MVLDYVNFCRQKFRHVEVALIEYRESLEERDIKSPEEIERKVEIRRRQLLSEYRLLDLNEDASGKSKGLLITKLIAKNEKIKCFLC